jgi:O-Antigen ligase
MVYTAEELIFVAGIGLLIFQLAKPIFLRFSEERDYARRRNIWLALTVTAFLSPNFWLFTLVAIPLIIWGSRKDKNPVALYLILLHVIPPLPIDIPIPGLKSLFSLDNYRLLSLCILIPAALRLRKSADTARIRGISAMDVLLVGYGALQVVLYVPPDLPNHVILQDSFTNELRSTLLFFVDTYILYYTVSRSCSNRELITEAQAAFCLSCLVMAALAVFESLRHWLPYTDIAVRWSGDPHYGYYAGRIGLVRAQVSAGNNSPLAYMLATACGFWLYLQSHVVSKLRRAAVAGLLWLGLLATFSRGPWLGAALIYAVVGALRTRKLSKLVKGAAGALLALGALSLTPFGERIIALLPFSAGSAGDEASSSIAYRQRLLERSWDLLTQYPFFGDQLAYQHLNDMRQGFGIIDMVNTYVEVGVFHGFVGLGMFVGFILIALVGAYRIAKKMTPRDFDLALLGFALVGCIIGTLLMLGTCSFILGYEKLLYVISGLAAAYANLGKTSLATQKSKPAEARVACSPAWPPTPRT